MSQFVPAAHAFYYVDTETLVIINTGGEKDLCVCNGMCLCVSVFVLEGRFGGGGGGGGYGGRSSNYTFLEIFYGSQLS